MSNEYGLRIWNGAGQLMMDAADRLSRHYGTFETGTSPGAFWVGPGQVWAVVDQGPGFRFGANFPSILVDGGQISWDWDFFGWGGARQSVRVTYGLY